MNENLPIERIENKIFLIRGQKVMIDRDLAELYGVTTSRLNEQVSRNIDRFPEDFMFQLTEQEFNSLISGIEPSNLMSQNAISSWGGNRNEPLLICDRFWQPIKNWRISLMSSKIGWIIMIHKSKQFLMPSAK